MAGFTGSISKPFNLLEATAAMGGQRRLAGYLAQVSIPSRRERIAGLARGLH